jgi:hypothetical protein
VHDREHQRPRRAGGRPGLRRGSGRGGGPAGILGSEELLAIIGNMPLGTLAAFPGLGVTDELIGTLVTAVNKRRTEATPGPRQRL